MIEAKWEFKEVNIESALDIAAVFGIPKTIANIMSLKNINSREKSKTFFYPKIDQLHNSFLMKDMQKTVERIISGINNKETILIFGDYDVDGTTSVAFLTLFFKSTDVDVHYYIPCRESEGYGLSNKGIDFAKYIGAHILITCDCGITNFEEIEYANEKGIDVLITDHHKPNLNLPNAYSIINPNRIDCNYPFKGLCGAGVVFKLALGICEIGQYDTNKVWCHSDIITLGIAADLVPISDENRAIVSHGIRQIELQTNIGITALRKTSGLWNKQISVGRIIFWLAPKINAAGRLGDAARAVKLLITKNPIFAKEIAEDLEKENEKRKDITYQITNEASRMVEANYNLEKDKIIVLQKEGWHPGVIGIVASRIKEIYNRPTIIISILNGEGKGSCRSISDFDIVDALNQCKEYLIGCGGHPMAAGLSIKEKNIYKFHKEIIKIANNKISTKSLQPKVFIDSELKFEDINNRMIKFLSALQPYGPNNMQPIFVSRNINVKGIPKLLGSEQNVLKFTACQNNIEFESIGFNMEENYEKLIQNVPIDIAYVIEQNEWNGNKTTQLQLKDLKLRK